MPRMQILKAAEHKAFDTPPVFSDVERDVFFNVSESLDTLLATLRSPINRVYLVLTVGYFRATKRFFTPPFRSMRLLGGRYREVTFVLNSHP